MTIIFLYKWKYVCSECRNYQIITLLSIAKCSLVRCLDTTLQCTSKKDTVQKLNTKANGNIITLPVLLYRDRKANTKTKTYTAGEPVPCGLHSLWYYHLGRVASMWCDISHFGDAAAFVKSVRIFTPRALRPNVAKRSVWEQCIYWERTDLAFWKISNGHISATGHPIHFMFGSRVRFSRSVDRMALLPVGPNPRSRPSAVLHNFEWPYLW